MKRRFVGANTVVGSAVLLIAFSLAHSFEDFVYGVPAQFGFSVGGAAALVGIFYGVHVVAVAYAAREYPWAYLANSLIGLLWLAGAVLDHGRDLLFTSPYREGAISKVFLVGVLVTAGLLIAVGYAAWRGRHRPPELRWRQRPGAL